MFKIDDPDTLLWPVEFNQPRNDGSGKSDPHQIKIRYQYLEDDAYQEVVEEVLNKDHPRVDFRDMITGWEDVADAEGNPLPFNEDNLKMVLSRRYRYDAIMSGFRACQSAGAEKN